MARPSAGGEGRPDIDDAGTLQRCSVTRRESEELEDRGVGHRDDGRQEDPCIARRVPRNLEAGHRYTPGRTHIGTGADHRAPGAPLRTGQDLVQRRRDRRGRRKELAHVAGEVATPGDDQRVVGHELGIVHLRPGVRVNCSADGDRAGIDRGERHHDGRAARPAAHDTANRDPRRAARGSSHVPEARDHNRACAARAREHEQTAEHGAQCEPIAVTSPRRGCDEHEHEDAAREQCGSDRYQSLRQRPEGSATGERAEDRHARRRSRGNERGDRRGQRTGEEDGDDVACRPDIRAGVVVNPLRKLPAQGEEERDADGKPGRAADGAAQEPLQRKCPAQQPLVGAVGRQLTERDELAAGSDRERAGYHDPDDRECDDAADEHPVDRPLRCASGHGRAAEVRLRVFEERGVGGMTRQVDELDRAGRAPVHILLRCELGPTDCDEALAPVGGAHADADDLLGPVRSLEVQRVAHRHAERARELG